MANIAQLLTEHIDIWTAAESEKKSGRGRVGGNTGSVYGVKKLRELILELAVRGKLVPQDPSDEPASELLKRIQAEKAKLTAEGKLKKEKPLAPITEDTKPYDLPKGWEWSHLNELADVIRGVTYGKSDASDNPMSDYVPLLRGNNIDRNLNFDKPVYVPRKLLNESQFVKKGDIVIAMSSGSADLVGKAAQAEADFNGGFGAFCGVVRSFSSELFSYFSCFFQTPYYRNTVAGYGKGIGINNLQKSSLISLKLPIPPIAEQHRIVAKIDELMALCDQLERQHSNTQEAHETLVSQLLATLTQSQNAATFNANWQRIYAHFDVLFTTEASIDALKQTLLQLAVMGKLVPQDPNDEPASELLKRIQAEKTKLIAEGKLKKEKTLAPIGDDEKSFELPKGWEWVRLVEIIKISSGDGLTASNMIADGGIPVFGGNGINGYHNRANINKETLVIGRVGYYCGSIHITPPKAWVTDNAFITQFSEANLFLNFLYWLLKITNLKENDNATAQPVISGAKIYPIVIALPPLAEQHRIVTKVDELMTLCDQLKTHIQQASQQQLLIADVLVAQAVA